MAKYKASEKSTTKPDQQSTERSASDPDERVDFEESLAEIEKIILQLESGELSLAESLEKYETAVARLKQCHRFLDAAERHVTLLAGFDAEGNPVTEALEELASEDSPSGRSEDRPPSRAGRRGVKKKRPSDGERNSDDSPDVAGHVDGSDDLF